MNEIKSEKRVSIETPFLLGNEGEAREDSLLDFETSKIRLQKRSWVSRHRNAVIFHSVMVCMYVLVTVALFSQTLAHQETILYTPAHDYIDLTVKTIHDSPHFVDTSEYVGESSPELDDAWYKLLRNHNIRITEEELRAMNQSTDSIKLNHGGGYQGMMGVFHELHCLKLVREALHQDYYYKGKTETQKKILVGHTEHCIDILREASLCRADTTVYPFHWSDSIRLPTPTWVQEHQCVDWNKLSEWLDSRRVDIFAPNMLVHPKYGPAYPGGKRISEPKGPQWYPLDQE